MSRCLPSESPFPPPGNIPPPVSLFLLLFGQHRDPNSPVLFGVQDDLPLLPARNYLQPPLFVVVLFPFASAANDKGVVAVEEEGLADPPRRSLQSHRGAQECCSCN